MELKAQTHDRDGDDVFGDTTPDGWRFDAPPADFPDGLPDEDENRLEGLPAAYAGRLDYLLDDVSQYEAWLAMQAASRARAVEQARSWAVVSDEFVLPNAKLTDTEREDWVVRVFVSEVATRLRLPEPSAGRLIDESRILVHELPATLDALSTATISYQHARVIIEQARTLPQAVRSEFEQNVLPDAVRLPVTQFRRRAVRARERMHPESVEDRTRAAVTERRFAFEADIDGMAWLHHHLPAAQALAAFNRVTDIATSLQGEGEHRTLAQLRSDVAADLLLDGMPADGEAGGEQTCADTRSDGDAQPSVRQAKKLKRAFGIRPTVVVTVPVLTLLGRSDEPGHLDGYGPIDPDAAKRLAGQAKSWIRLLTHPETGAVLSLGKNRYKVPKDLRTWLEIRDETCRWPGCGRAATRTDIDHTEDWAKGGSTDASNLACLCKPHHVMKHLTRWQVMQRGHGVLDWRSPTGHVYSTRPAVELPGTTTPPGSGTLKPPGVPTDDPPF